MVMVARMVFCRSLGVLCRFGVVDDEWLVVGVVGCGGGVVWWGEAGCKEGGREWGWEGVSHAVSTYPYVYTVYIYWTEGI